MLCEMHTSYSQTIIGSCPWSQHAQRCTPCADTIGDADTMNAHTDTSSIHNSNQPRAEHRKVLMGKWCMTYRVVVVGLSLPELFGAQVKVCNHLLLAFTVCGGVPPGDDQLSLHQR